MSKFTVYYYESEDYRTENKHYNFILALGEFATLYENARKYGIDCIISFELDEREEEYCSILGDTIMHYEDSKLTMNPTAISRCYWGR